jgi:hypothetical protein
MSYTYLLEQGEESSAECFSDIPACVLSRSNLTAGACCSPGNGTASCHDSPSGMMSGRSTGDRGAGASMSSAEGSRVRTLASPERGPGSTAIRADYGERWRESFAKWDRDSCSWKTRQLLLLGDLEPFSETWWRWGMMRDGVCWVLPTPVLRTGGNGFGSWATPAATDGKRGGVITAKMTGQSLAQMVKTPAAWPTPTKCDGSGGPGRSDKRTGCDNLRTAIGGSLNPPWVEWLMGWPLGWTDLKPSATDKFQQWCDSHGISSRPNGQRTHRRNENADLRQDAGSAASNVK